MTRGLLVLFWTVPASALLCASAAAADLSPPAGLQPTTMTLSQLMALHEHAVGGTAAPLPESVEHWAYARGNLAGTQVRISSGDDYLLQTVLGPFHTASGSYKGQAWEQDANGLTMRDSGIHRRDQIDEEALRNPLATASAFKLLGQTDSDPQAYVVRLSPPAGRVAYLFYDKRSFQVVRVERAVENRRVVTTFDDFRATNGRTAAWHVHESDGRPYNDVDWKLVQLDYRAHADPALFQPAQSDMSHVKLAAPRAVLPGKITADRVILTGQLGGHKVDFQLDSGASEILLDESVARALHLELYGTRTESTAGTYVASRTVVPHIDFGDASIANVAVLAAPFHYWEDLSTPVAGLLGFDFIASCVVHVDYLHGTAEALDVASFQPPSTAIALPIRLDDGVPVVSVRIGATTSDRFILDTGADRSVLFSSFAAGHPADIVDQGLGELFTEAYPFLDEVNGVGGQVQVSHIQVPSLVLGSAVFPRWLFSVTHDAPAFEGEDYDGLIGQDVLRNFDLYLDYPAMKIYLVPNDRYRERWG